MRNHYSRELFREEAVDSGEGGDEDERLIAITSHHPTPVFHIINVVRSTVSVPPKLLKF